MDSLQLAEAFASLRALKDNLPEHSEVEEKYVRRFHAILDDLSQGTGYDLNKFRIPSSEVRPTIVSQNYLTGGELQYSEDNWCERNFLMMNVDGVLNLFELTSSSEKRQIGFKPPSK